MSLLLLLGAYFFFTYEENLIHQKRHEELKAINTLKIKEIEYWLNDRRHDAVSIYKQAKAFLRTPKIIRNHDQKSITKELEAKLNKLNNEKHFANLFLLTKSNKILLATKPSDDGIDSTTKQFAQKSLKLNKLINTDLYLCKADHKIHMDLIAPLRNRNNKTLAVLIFRINPNKYLYPLLQDWPTSSRTSEIVLTRKEGNYAIVLNNLKNEKIAALNKKISLSLKENPAVHAVLGYKGFFEGKDLKGRDVLSDIEPILNTNWYLISKVNESEFYTPLYTREIFIISFVVLLILLISLGRLLKN